MKCDEKSKTGKRSGGLKSAVAMVSVLLAAFAALSAVRPAHADPPGGTTGWTQTFNDDFNGASLDAAKWNKTWINGGVSVGWSQEVMKPENVTVANGLASIRQWCNPNEHAVYGGVDYGPMNQSGVITTYGGKFSQMYGYFEARMKMAPGNGNLSAFWMSSEATWPPELDFTEVLGRLPQETNMTQHWGTVDANGNHPSSLTMWNAGQDLTATWHTYGCEWSASEIVWYVDGVERKRMANNINVAMYLELNIHSGNSWAGYPDNTDPTQHFMQIDYVRAWKRGTDTGTTVSTGNYRIISVNSGKALDVSNYSQSNGANVQQWTYSGGNNQRWYVESLGNSEYRIKALHSNKYLNVATSSISNGAQIQQWSWTGATNQKFRIESVGSGAYRIVNVNSGKALDVEGGSTSDGALVKQWDFWGGANQKWLFQAP